MLYQQLPNAIQFIHYVTRVFNQFGTLLDERMATLGLRHMNRTWNGEHFPALLQRHARGDKRAAL